jgi:hypothetical protein
LLVERLTTDGNWQRINSVVTKRRECYSSVQEGKDDVLAGFSLNLSY